MTADVVRLYPGIPFDEGLEVLRKKLNAFDNNSDPTEDLVKMADLFSGAIIFNLSQLVNIRFW